MPEIRGKYELELNFVNDRVYLNFWDWHSGKDVIAEVNKDGQMSIDGTGVTFLEYITRVKKSIQQRSP